MLKSEEPSPNADPMPRKPAVESVEASPTFDVQQPLQLNERSKQQARLAVIIWRSLLRAWITFRGDKITPVRLASHLALLSMAVLVLVLSRIELPTWDIVRIAVPAQAQTAEEPAELAFQPLPVGGSPLQESGVLVRAPVPFTEIPDRPRSTVVTYTVQLNDTVLGIAEGFKLSPNTIMWANLDDLNSPFVMEVGQVLRIPPIDGVLHTVKEGDTVASIAKLYEVSTDEIVGYAGNNLANADAGLAADAVVIVPNGVRSLPKPEPPASTATTSSSSSSSSSSSVPAPSARGGTGTSAPWRANGFVWPTWGTITQRYYYPAHPAIDIGAPLGTAVVAADEGSIIASGWSNLGYGYMIMISHPDGYVTLYGHMSWLAVSVGDYVGRGQRIGNVGSTGRSTGPHLHFEVRRYGYYYNPLVYLP